MTALREIIQARGLSVDKLTYAGLAEERLEELLNDAEPSVDEVRAIARVLRLPVRELIIGAAGSEISDTKLRANFGRNVSSELEFECAQATYRAQELGDFVSQTGLPLFKDFPKTAATAEELSQIVRKNLLKIGDVEPLTNTAEIFYDLLGVVSVVTHFRSIEGASSRAGGAALVLLSPRPSSRMRFTFCHEVCHLLVDLDPEQREVWLDDSVMSPRHEHHFEEESFANAFSSAVLLPLRGVAMTMREFRDEHGGPDDGVSAPEILNLARTYGTSFLVAAIRLEAMEILPEGAAQTLQASLTKEFGSPEKFADSIGIRESRTVDWKYPAKKIMSDFSTKFSSGEYSFEYISGISGLTIAEAMSAYHGSVDN